MRSGQRGKFKINYLTQGYEYTCQSQTSPEDFEVYKTLQKTKAGKASGPDGIKRCIPIVKGMLNIYEM